jgi:nicotinamide mononucleotide transporter
MTKWFDYSFLAFGLLIQVVTYFISLSTGVPVSLVSLVSGCLGVCSVCLLAQGNIWTFFLGFAQVGTYTYLCIEQRFYGEIAINAYYFLTMIYGVYAWKRRLRGDEQTVYTRSLSMPVFGVIILATLFLSGLVGVGLAAYTDDTQPYLDAFTTVPALVAQVLMILVYREHWFVWLAVDMLSVVLWLRAGDYCMAAQYAFWCANCLFGLHRWKSLINHQS